MSKKKAFAGNTMTLKDFHGGSIPSDLPLPSAPGVCVRSSEWSGYDRPNSWGGPMGDLPDHHRARPSSSPATSHLDDKTPFLNHTCHIGPHFDEDERKPLDGVSVPRRTVSDESFRGVASGRLGLMPEPVSSRRVIGSAMGPQVASSYSGRVSEGSHVGASSQNVGGNNGQSAGSHPNIWAARKELAVGVNEPVQSAWSGASAVSKLAHASAPEKVSSGRWQSKHSIQYQADVEVFGHLETDKGLGYAHNRMGAVGSREYSDATLARHVERSLAIEDRFQGGRKEYVDHERTRAAPYSELKERNLSEHTDRVQPQSNDFRFNGSEFQSSVQSEPSERPKGYQQLSSSANGHIGKGDLNGHVNAAKSGLANESQNQVIERPKLSLKPRSQPLEQSEETRERERVALFGGARPREMVLKARGIDGASVSNHDMGQHPHRVKHNVPKVERIPEHAVPTRHGERTDNMPLDQRTGKKFERKDQRVDKQRRIRRNENWRDSREIEKQQQPQVQQERPPSPETWRKPVEQLKSACPDATGQRYGKTASALELAQAFSKSFSDPKPADQFSGQRSLPGKTQVPFSRLMGPTPATQINGY
ncbi:uncharacterized protein LOC8267423 [Ricinus communis]|uniref:uncharacterized protein LOC8267423 n=1 Tax=Ricinus communis TaxID=3988 RepID=UPI00201A4181|nr:uncharacterized protein LOC8267423 [Ricinus communis]XP_025012974.2 uncharacterized protein LOC8267423 [Ricinus communis]